MDGESFGKRLRNLREARGIGVRELGRLTGINHATLSQAENGKRWVGKLPSYEDLSALARVFEMTIAELVDTAEAEPLPEIQTVPLGELLRRINARPAYGDRADDLKASAGKKKGRVPQEYDDSRLRKRLGQTDLPARIQLIEVEGDCMLGIFSAGDIVHVDIEQTPEIGDVVAAMRFYDELIVKFLREKDGRQYFESRDGSIVVPFDQYTRIIGPVVDVQRSIKRILAEL